MEILKKLLIMSFLIGAVIFLSFGGYEDELRSDVENVAFAIQSLGLILIFMGLYKFVTTKNNNIKKYFPSILFLSTGILIYKASAIGIIGVAILIGVMSYFGNEDEK